MTVKRHASRLPVGPVAAGLGLLIAACAPGPVDGPVGRASQPLVTADSPLADHAAVKGGVASAVDEQGVPGFIFAVSREAPPALLAAGPAALWHVERYQTALGLRPEALQTLEPYVNRDLGPGGLLTRVRQRVGGIEVYGSQLRVLMRQDRTLVALAGHLHPTIDQIPAFVQPPEAGLADALTHVLGQAVPTAWLRATTLEGDDEEQLRFRLADGVPGLAMPEGALLHKVLYPAGDKLRPAWNVEFYAGKDDETSTEAWRYVVAADDGTILERHSLTQNDAFTYRVFADATGDNRPTDSALSDFTPHPTGKLDYAFPAPATPVLINMEGFNKNPMGKADPWLAAGAKDTQGNNADAYSDKKSPDGIGGGDYRATVTSPGVFDRMYDFKADPATSKEQVQVGILNAFYDVNWMHDYFYDSGFNEKAGNAQKENYSRGGKANDAMRVETQDYSGRDNANMSTPSDGLSPRMQMFLWGGKEQRVLQMNPGDITLTSNSANFGPDKFDISGEVVEVNDMAFNTTDACESIKNAAAVKDKIALIDRGTCTFKLKSVNAEVAGAKAVIIVNNQTGGAPGMGNGAPMSTVLNIPVLSTTINGGAKIREALLAGPVTIRLARVRDIDRDAALDATVVTHEWGHYLHHRLADCVQHQCGAMSEGWADFNALMMVAHDGDDLDGVYPLAIHAGAASPFPGYFGIRRYPYSTNFTKNPLTFKYIADGVVLPTLLAQSGGGPNSEVHNSGEVWSNMLWEVYVALQKDGRTRSPALTFEEVRRKMADYVVAGHEMTPRNATYSETRDALLAVAQARDPRDFTVIAEAFARRGLGTCADSPPRDSQDHKGAVEAFKVQPRLVLVETSLEVQDDACDKDKVLDAGEKGQIKITLANGAPTVLDGAKVTLSSNLPEVTFDGPNTFTIPSLKPLERFEIMATVKVDQAMARSAMWKLKVDGDTATNCQGTAPELSWKINYDVREKISRVDDVEAEPGVWTPGGTLGGGGSASSVWGRGTTDVTNHAWHGIDVPVHSDTWIESPDLQVSTSTWFSMSFRHRYSFEFDTMQMPTGYFDGGVIELSQDGGMTWKDVSTWVTPPYNARVADGDVAITGQLAFVGQSTNWPRLDTVRLNFTDTFAGKTVRVRFRIATDQRNGTGTFFGWDIDDIAFEGIDNTPFTAVTFDAGKCGTGPRGPELDTNSESGCSVHRRSGAGALAPAVLLLGALLGLGARRRRRAA